MEALSGDGAQKLATAEDIVRRGFIKKVYGLLAVQLALTTAIAAPFMAANIAQLQSMVWLLTLASVLSIAIMLGVSCCCIEVARKFPTNYLFLFSITLCEAVIVGFVSATYTVSSVLMAAGITSILFVGLTLFAIFTKTDFTGFGPYLFAASLGLMVFGIFAIFFHSIQVVYASLGAILFSFYIVFDTQMIVRGRHQSKYQYSVDDYVFAALSIYLDIINLFFFLLEIFGSRR